MLYNMEFKRTSFPIQSKVNCVQITIDLYSIVFKCIGISIRSQKQLKQIYRKFNETIPTERNREIEQFPYKTQSKQNYLVGFIYSLSCVSWNRVCGSFEDRMMNGYLFFGVQAVSQKEVSLVS